MIVTVTPNVALDLTYQLDGLRVGEVNRALAVAERAGGKGVNVARVLAAHGIPVRALGLCGGTTGERVRALLGEIEHDFTPIAAETRRTVVLADGETATGVWEPGPVVSPAEWERLRERVSDSLPIASVLVLAGSLPPGVPVDGYGALIRAARAAGVPVILDADGEPLRHGLAAGPTLAKPNAAEFAALTGHSTATVPAALAASARLATASTDIVVSLGPLGLLAITAAGRFLAAPSRRFTGNATGAGDAAVAALALGLAGNESWPARLRRAVGWSAAAAAAPLAGELAPGIVDDLAVTVESV